MTHLTDAEFVDLLDPEQHAMLPADRLRHLETCDGCRTQAGALRAALAETVSDPAPEPSPLFWDYFAARVSDAIRDESPATPAVSSFAAWRRRPLAEWAVAASIAVLVMMTVVWRATLHAPAPYGPPVMTVAPAAAPHRAAESTASDAPAPDDVENDEAWAVVRTAAEGFRWEDAHAVGITAGPGAAEGLALELTAAERTELARLIDSEMKRTGA